jgi:hypothetical protein
MPVQPLSIQEAVEQRVVKRQNFGTNFRFLQTIYVVTDSYTHHLVLDLPARNVSGSASRLVPASHPKELNKRFEEWTSNISPAGVLATAIRQEILYLQAITDTIYELFTEIDPSALGNRKRRFFCFQFCWGVADAADLEILQKTVEANSNTTEKNFEKIQKSLSAMASYSRLAEKKFEALKYIVERQQTNTAFAERAMRNMQLLTGSLINVFLPNALHLTSLHSSLTLLKHKILTYEILPPNHASSIMQQIIEHVSHWPLRYVVHPDPLSLYKDTDLSYFRTSSSLHIGLKIKISYFRQPLHLFRVERFHMGVPNQAHDTIIQNLPNYVALNQDDDEYLTFEQMPRLYKNLYYNLDDQEHSMFSKESPSCLMALFHDQPSQITKLCDSFLQPFSAVPIMRHVGANLVLFKNIESYQVFTSTTESVVMQTNCTACLKKLPCPSKVRAQQFVTLVPTCPLGQDWRNSEVSAHLINLQVVGPLLTDELLDSLSAEFAFGTEVNITLPNLTIYEPPDSHKLSQAFKTLGLQAIHLTAAINQSLEKGLIFQTPTDHAIYKFSMQGLAYNVRASFDAFCNFIANPFGIVTKIITALQCIAIAYLLYRVHILGAALAVRAVAAQVVKEANETQIRKLEEFFYRPTTSNPNRFVIDYKPEISGQFHVLDFVVVVLLTFIGSYIIYQFIITKRRRNSFQIIMDVFGTHGRTTMTVMHLPHHSSMYHYKADSFIERLSIRGILFPHLSILWPSFSVEHKFLAQKFAMPQSLLINPWQAYKLRRIIASRFEVLLLARNANADTYHLVPIQGSMWQQLPTIVDTQRPRLPMWTPREEDPPQYV